MNESGDPALIARADEPSVPPDPALASDPSYRVLARKYRPGDFRDLIGQEAMVRTLTNAFAHDRIAHAFIMTGVRGVGKTTTARIVAKGLNCTRGDGPAIDPCGACDACVSIAEGRNVDVLEMDAASNTGVGDIREIIESVRYRAASARYKVYIVDEVHMLSTSAFNALLKTLEEPPPHVKFIFATTEIRKVPVTVLSRCQRFDLRRIEPEAMVAHLAGIAKKEGAALSDGALALIARAAEGSVRDALSLLDQAVAHGTGAEIGAEDVRAMLGLADRGRTIDLFEAVMKGDAAGALRELSAQYADGADPAAALRDLAELTHWISVVKLSEDALQDPAIGADERDRGRRLAQGLSMRVLTRAWQMLLKALEELAIAPNAMTAAEMAVIRLTHVADLPSPGDLVKKLTEDAPAPPPPPAPAPNPPPAPVSSPKSGDGDAPGSARGNDGGSDGGGGGGGGNGDGPRARAVGGGADIPAPQARERPAALAGIEDIVAVLSVGRNVKLQKEVEDFVSLVDLRPGVIEFNPLPGAPSGLAGRLGQALTSLTGRRWTAAVTERAGAETLRSLRETEDRALRAKLADHPAVRTAREVFGEVEILNIRPLRGANPVFDPVPANRTEDFPPDPPPDLLDDSPGDWSDDPNGDPFEETA